LPTKVSAGKNFVQIAWIANYNGGTPILDFELDWKLTTDNTYTTL
jgi:hypothetical protein